MKETIKFIVMATLCLNFSLKAQEPTKPPPLKNQGLIGKIISASTGEVLPGAVVKIINTNQTLLSNDQGEFMLSLPNGNYTLSVHYLSYKTKSFNIQIPLKEQLVIALDTDENSLNEIEINAGYYTVKDKERTGSISRVTAETIGNQPVSNPMAALIGRISGVQITQQTGVPGGGFGVQIRGKNSIASGSQPLYIINGVPIGSNSLASSLGDAIVFQASPLNSINPADIESIEVLKDADATSIYGSRGANGVVLITTKKAKPGTTSFDVNYAVGMGKVAKKMELLSTEAYIMMRKEAFKNDGRSPTAVNAPDLISWDQTRNVDWQKELLGGTAHTDNLQVSLAGGNQNTNFLISGGYNSEGTVFPGNFGDKRGTGSFNVSHVSGNHKLKILLSSQYSLNRSNLFNYDITTSALTKSPNAPDFIDENGKLVFYSSITNPYADLYRKYNSSTKNFLGNLNLSYQLLPELSFKISAGYTDTRRDEVRLIPATTISPTSSTVRSSDFSDNSINTWITEPQLSYIKKIGSGVLSSFIGSTFQSNLRKGQVISASGFSSDEMLENIRAATSVIISSNDYSMYNYAAFFGRLNYNLAAKYILNFTIRRDGSSRFGNNKQYSSFASLGSAWIFSNEEYVKNRMSFISFGKLRGSYGTSGNDQIGDYQFLELWKVTNYPYGGTSGIYPDRISNQDYAWEINRKLELALELGFFRDKLKSTITYYNNRSSNQLVGFSLPPSTGAISIQSNLPAVVENRGFELELNSINLERGKFKWQTSVNITLPKNTLLAYPNIESSPYANTYTVGKSLSTLKAFHLTQVDPKTGVYTFQDLNEDNIGTTYPEDLQAIKDLGQKFYGGVSNNFQYKGFQLDVFVQFVKQLGYDYKSIFNSPGSISNQPAIVLRRWQNIDDVSTIQKFSGWATTKTFNAYRAIGDHRITDASFLRIKNIALSYSLEQNLVKKLRLRNLRIYFQGQNLFTVTNYLGLDPENGSNGSLPPLRVCTFGLMISI